LKKIILSVLFLSLTLLFSGCSQIDLNEPQKSRAEEREAIGGGGGSGGGEDDVEYRLSDLPDPFVKDGSTNNKSVVVYGEEDFAYSIATSMLITYFDDYVGVDGDKISISSDMVDLSQYDNLVLVGSPCRNSKVAEYMDLVYPSCVPANGIIEGGGMIKLIEENDKTILIVAADDSSGFYRELLEQGAQLIVDGGLFGTEHIYTYSEPMEVTYEGVLDMLNSCEIKTSVECYDEFIDFDSCDTCDEICSNLITNSSTCITAAKSRYEGNITYIPI